MKNIAIKFNIISIENLLNIHKECDLDFIPKLSSLVNINEYCIKLYKYSEKISIYVDEVFAGVLCIYANDEENKKAYISSVIIKSNFRGLKLGNLLIQSSFIIARQKNMKTIKLEVGTKSKIAINLYKKFGFVIEKRGEIISKMKVNV